MGGAGTWGCGGPGAELQDNRLPLMLLLLLPSLMSQWSDKEELVEPVEEAQREKAGPNSLPSGSPEEHHMARLASPSPGITEPEQNYIYTWKLKIRGEPCNWLTMQLSWKFQRKAFGHRKEGTLMSTETLFMKLLVTNSSFLNMVRFHSFYIYLL